MASGRVRRALDPVAAPVHDPLVAIEELRQRVASALGSLVDPRGAALNSPALTPPLYDAYEQFVSGQDVYWRGDWEASLPHFRRAVALDTSFHSALAFVGVVGVGTGRCELTDSVARELTRRGDRVPELDRITAQISQARCASDHAEHNRLQRRRAALMPGSKLVQLTMSTGFRQLNLAAEAQAILGNIDPARDLGWIPERGRAFYWREVTATQHALGDYRAERATAARMAAMGGSRLAVGYFAARSLAALGHIDSVHGILTSIADAPIDPAILSGIIGGRLNPVALATPGWVMYQVALELAARGHEHASARAVRRSIAWFEQRGPVERLPVEQRFVLAQALVAARRLDDARTLLTALVALDTSMIEFRGALGVVAAQEGDRTAAREVDEWLAARRGGHPPGAPALFRAEIAAITGDTAAAMEIIESLPRGAHPYDWLQFHIDPAFAELRKSERFHRFLVPKG